MHGLHNILIVLTAIPLTVLAWTERKTQSCLSCAIFSSWDFEVVRQTVFKIRGLETPNNDSGVTPEPGRNAIGTDYQIEFLRK